MDPSGDRHINRAEVCSHDGCDWANTMARKKPIASQVTYCVSVNKNVNWRETDTEESSKDAVGIT